MKPEREVLALLRKARAASRGEKKKSLQKRDYAEKEFHLAEAIRKYRSRLWIGFDPSEPGFYLIVGPRSSNELIALHFPVKKAKRLKLDRFIRGLDEDQDRPSPR